MKTPSDLKKLVNPFASLSAVETMCGGMLFTSWSVPCQLDKCFSCFSRRRRPLPPLCDFQFKPYNNNPDAIHRLLTTYENLRDGSHFRPRARSCCGWIIYALRRSLLWLLALIVVAPPFAIIIVLIIIYYVLKQMVMIPMGVIMIRCGCNLEGGTSRGNVSDQYTVISTAASKEEQKRFELYVKPIVIWNVGTHLWQCLSQYLVGLFEANLIEDELIILWLHLYGTSKVHPVYEYDENSEPVRIKGIMEDYSSWCNKESATNYFEGMSMEIVSVFVDYDDDNRITFNLLNGETVTQPRPSPDAVRTQSVVNTLKAALSDVTSFSESLDFAEERRVWDIVKAHWQSQLSIWPALVHNWVHFHFNDLTVGYIEERWKTGIRHCSDSVMDRIIRSHTYFTAFLNSAGPADGFFNPQMRRWNLCLWLFAPWKALPFPTESIHPLFISDITAFWFKESDETMATIREATIRGTLRDTMGDVLQLDVSKQSNLANATVELQAAVSTEDTEMEKTLSMEQLCAMKSVSSALEIKSIQRATSLQHINASSYTVGSVVRELKKEADPDCFPPIFVRNRLEMFEGDFKTGKQWIEMHRGYHIYKDFLADYYRVIHEEFVQKLYEKCLLKDDCLERWITFLENEGFPGVRKCKRGGNYVHIFSTFIWLNVVHAADHVIANNIVRKWGVNASLVPLHSQQWYREHGDYDYLDVLEGKDWKSRWRIQWYAMRIRVFWGTFGGPWNQGGFHADHMIDSHLFRHFRDIDGITEDERKQIDVIHMEYIRKMKECDEKYRWLMRVEDFTAGIQY